MRLYEKENSWSENAGIVLEAFAKPAANHIK